MTECGMALFYERGTPHSQSALTYNGLSPLSEMVVTLPLPSIGLNFRDKRNGFQLVDLSSVRHPGESRGPDHSENTGFRLPPE